MSWVKILVVVSFVISTLLVAQEIPAGTALPVMLNSSLDAGKDKPGKEISARLMQDVPLPGGERIPAGSRLLGHVLRVSRPGTTSGSHLVFRFEQVVIRGHAIPLTTDLRAVASLTEVYEAQLPTNALDDYQTSYNDWNTVQVGGDAVYRGSGQVMVGDQVVGKVSIGGDVIAKLIAVPERGCRGAIDRDDQEQALWVFSTSACGTYGLGELKIAHAGRTVPVGEIALESPTNVHVRSGSGLLLRVQAPAANSLPAQ